MEGWCQLDARLSPRLLSSAVCVGRRRPRPLVLSAPLRRRRRCAEGERSQAAQRGAVAAAAEAVARISGKWKVVRESAPVRAGRSLFVSGASRHARTLDIRPDSQRTDWSRKRSHARALEEALSLRSGQMGRRNLRGGAW